MHTAFEAGVFQAEICMAAFWKLHLRLSVFSCSLLKSPFPANGVGAEPCLQLTAKPLSLQPYFDRVF